MDTATIRRTSDDRAHRYATMSAVGAAGFVTVVAALHVIKRDLDPDWRVLSEYQIGANGWLMSVAFVLLASSCVCLALALRPHLRSLGGRVGLVFLGVTALGLLIAAMFTTDPITASSDELTTHGTLHGVGAGLGIPGQLIAASLISRSLVRRAGWSSGRRWLYGTAVAAWLSVAVYGVCMAAMYDGEYGPDVHIGWPNRLIVATSSAWLIATAIEASRRHREQEQGIE
jgi:hypothetical protein